MTRIIGNPTSLQKLAHVNPSAVKGQGSTRSIYHYVKLTSDKTYEFFTNLNNTNEIFKNLETNKLTQGEALVVKRINFPAMIVDPLGAPNSLLDMTNYVGVGFVQLLAGKLDVVVGNQTVIKDYPIAKALSFNKQHYYHISQMNIELESEIVIPANVEFKVVLKQIAQANLIPDNLMIGIMLDGYGKIMKLNRTI